MREDRYSWIWLALLCLFGFVHSATYAITNPVFESPDEPGHLEYVNRFASGKAMPDQYDAKSFLPEGHQNPLYYFVAGEIFRITGGPIHVSLPVSHTPAPAPYFDHRPNPFHSSRDRFLFYGLRLAGCLLAAFSVMQTGRAAKRLMPVGLVWMVAPLIVAMLPQLAFIGASVSNDALVAFFGACVAYAAACCSVSPSTRRNWILLGVYLGLAYLSKKNGIALAPAALVFIAAMRCYGSRGFSRKALAAVGVAALLFMPLLFRNWLLYRDPLGTRMETETLYGLVYPQSLHSWHLRYIVPHVVPVSFVAQFGWMVVEVKADFVWRMVWMLALFAACGLFALFDKRLGPFALFAWAAFLGNVIALVYYNLLFPQAQGRLLFPSLACFALLCAMGLYEISSRVNFRYKALAFVPLVIWFLWFDLLCFYTNQNFYSWFGPRLGF